MILGPEPIVVVSTIVAGLQAVQYIALPIPVWGHCVIAATFVALGAWIQRSQVSPAPMPPPPPPPPSPSDPAPPTRYEVVIKLTK